MTTLNKISEQIREIYLRSFDPKDRNRKIDLREIKELVVQEANSVLSLAPVKTKAFRLEDFPALMLATYTARPLVTAGTKYSIALPVKPINLPNDMGVWEIVPEDGPSLRSYIPLVTGMYNIIADLDEADLEDQIGYRVEGSSAIFTKKPEATTFTLKMFVLDPSAFAATDILPITADMEADIVIGVLKKLGVPSPQDNQEIQVSNE